MKVSYYTVDDLRLGYDPRGVSGWRLSNFLSLDDALEHYMHLPPTRVKSLGLTDGVHCLEIARCVSLFEYDKEGEDILASDYKKFPLWADMDLVRKATQACISKLQLRYILCSDAIVPIPKADTLPSQLKDKFLWLNAERERDSAIMLVYNAGTGWIPLKEWKRRSYKHPLILKIKADGLTESGTFVSLEVEPWEYDLLVRRTLDRLHHNSMKSGGKNT